MRRQLTDMEAIEASLERGTDVRLLLVKRNTPDPRIGGILAKAERLGVTVRTSTANDLRRMNGSGGEVDLIALTGPDPSAGPEELLALGGAVWLLAGIAYPGNAGFAIRTAEVSGADGIFIDSPLVGRIRQWALRAGMHAERFFPVHWEPASKIVAPAKKAGKRILAIEDSGARAPWDLDLTGSLLFILGGEERGIPADLLAASDEVIRLPMAGFIPSFNVHAAMAAVASERLRQTRIG